MTFEIENIYSFISEEKIKSYILSVTKTDDLLGFDYYILAPNEKKEYCISEVPNPLILLEQSNIKLTKIYKNTYEYNSCSKIFKEKYLSNLEGNKRTK